MQKKKHLFALIAIAMTIFSSCSKSDSTNTPSTPNPVADFSYSGNGLAPSTVTFTNTSTNATVYSWDFGDGSLSSSQNPTHTFTQGGVYTVRLTATNSSGSNSISKTVNIQTPVSARIDKIILGSVTNPPSGNFDLYFKINSWASGTYSNINVSSFPISFSFSSPYTALNLNATYNIDIYKKNTILSDTKIGTSPFIPNLYTTGTSAYPKSVTIPSSINGSGMIIYITWQ